MRFGLLLAALGLISCTSASPTQPQCTPPGASVPCDCGGAEGRAFCGADQRLGTCVCPDAAAQTDAAAADAGRDVGIDHLPTPPDSAVDAGTDAQFDAAADAPLDAAPEDRGDAPHADVASDIGHVPYPSGPYGSRVGAVFEPFALTACNREGDAARWRFDQADFRDNRLTLLMISAMWCIPCQNEAMQVERELVQRYAGRGLRIVQVLVQDPQRRAITPAQCTTWVSRYGLSFPVLMDPQFVTQPFVPMGAFPGNVLVDAQGIIRWREYGSENGLRNIREAIDAVLSPPSPDAGPDDASATTDRPR